MPNIISRQDAEALIQEQIVGTISQEAPQHSTFMQLARRLPNMTSRQTRIPVLDMLPMAYWVNGDTGFKQTSMQKWENVFLTAEELAVIVKPFLTTRASTFSARCSRASWRQSGSAWTPPRSSA